MNHFDMKARETLDIDMGVAEGCQEKGEKNTNTEPMELFPLNDYDTVILHLLGGADSMRCLFWLKKGAVPA